MVVKCETVCCCVACHTGGEQPDWGWLQLLVCSCELRVSDGGNNSKNPSDCQGSHVVWQQSKEGVQDKPASHRVWREGASHLKNIHRGSCGRNKKRVGRAVWRRAVWWWGVTLVVLGAQVLMEIAVERLQQKNPRLSPRAWGKGGEASWFWHLWLHLRPWVALSWLHRQR